MLWFHPGFHKFGPSRGLSSMQDLCQSQLLLARNTHENQYHNRQASSKQTCGCLQGRVLLDRIGGKFFTPLRTVPTIVTHIRSAHREILGCPMGDAY